MGKFVIIFIFLCVPFLLFIGGSMFLGKEADEKELRRIINEKTPRQD
jgi:hypothetical protein